MKNGDICHNDWFIGTVPDRKKGHPVFLFYRKISWKGGMNMAEKDIAEKLLEEHNDVFADIFNVLLFKKDFVNPEELSDAPTEFHYWTKDQKGCRELRRDVAKLLRKNGKPVAILCIENQTCIDKSMPFRTQEYNSATYMMQIKNKKETPLPVITIVLYFGKRKWKPPFDIKEVISKGQDIPEEIMTQIPSYEMNLIEIAFLPENIIKKFTSDFGIIADFLVNTRENADSYIPSKKEILHLKELLFFMEVITDDSRFGTLFYEIACKQKGAVSMCELLDLYWNRGKNAGNAEGRIEGRSEGRVSMLVSYLQNSNDNPEALANTFKLLGATSAEISEAKRIYNESKKETITSV